MTNEQKEWLNENPRFSVWKPQPIVSIKSWTDVGFVSPDGRFIPDGKGVPFIRGIISSGDTLYVVPKNSVKVGREYHVV